MNIRQTLVSATQKIKDKNIKNPHFEAEILLSHILGKTREFILTYPEVSLTSSQLNKYKKLLKQRLEDYPIAYLVKEKYFFGNLFFVDQNVLIPRPETELIVEEALKIIKGKKIKTILDVGTGSGCLIISLAKILGNKVKNFLGADISKQALLVAQKNAKLNNVGNLIGFIKADLLNFDFKSLLKKGRLLIIANLPYLTPKQIKKSPSIKKEPKLALAAGPDGLKYYKKLFLQIKHYSCSNISIIIEFDPSQKKLMSKLIKSIFPQAKNEIKKDLKGHYRIALINL